MPNTSCYRRLFSYETRLWLYKLRNPALFKRMRSRVNKSEKGDFSLRSFDRHQCVFVHITKSAGTSVALSLFGELPFHRSACDYRVIFGRRDFNRYYKFAFVRNPWDRLYSAFSYLKRGGWGDTDADWPAILEPYDDINAFVEQWLSPERLNSHRHFWPQHRFICDSRGRVLLDYCGRFETLAEDFETVNVRLQLGATLAATNSSRRKGDYREVYSAKARQKVGELYANDIRLLGYRFDGWDSSHDIVRSRL